MSTCDDMKEVVKDCMSTTLNGSTHQSGQCVKSEVEIYWYITTIKYIHHLFRVIKCRKCHRGQTEDKQIFRSLVDLRCQPMLEKKKPIPLFMLHLGVFQACQYVTHLVAGGLHETLNLHSMINIIGSICIIIIIGIIEMSYAI